MEIFIFSVINKINYPPPPKVFPLLSPNLVSKFLQWFRTKFENVHAFIFTGNALLLPNWVYYKKKKCKCTCKTVEKRWRIHVHANNKINTFYFRMHCKFSKTIRIWKNKILSSLTNAISIFLSIQVMRKRNECLIYLFFASYRWHITHVWTSPVFVLIYELRRLNRTWNH